MDIEDPSVPAHAALLENERAGAFQFERNSHDGDDGDADDAAHQTTDNVQSPLQYLIVQLELVRAHGHNIAPGTAAQSPAHPDGAGLAAAGLFDAVQDRQTEVDGQTHALDLFQVRHEGVAAFGRDINVDLVQRRLTEPIHKIGIVGLDCDTVDPTSHFLIGRFQYRDPGDLLRPVPPKLLDDGRRTLPRRHDADKALKPLRIFGAAQSFFEQRVSTHHHERIDNRHHNQKIPRIQHGCLGQRQARHIQ